MPGSGGPSAKARTLEEVANITGVSRATVSRVLNGGSVSPKTRARVEAAMTEHGYHPNLAARSLASGRTGVVGLVLHSSASALRCDDHFLLLHQGITEALALQTTGVMEWFAHRPPPEILANILSSRFVDGMIATTTALDDPLVEGLVASDIPTVVVGNRRFVAAAATVDIDERAAALDAVEHLLERGASRIGHITGLRGTVSAEARLAGYYQALDSHGVRERFVTEGKYSEDGGYQATQALLESGVDAVFAASDHTAVGVYRAAHERGLRIPDDLAVVGFDDLEFAARLDPPLTTIHQDPRLLGETAARVLLEVIADRGPVGRHITLPTHLAVRNST